MTPPAKLSLEEERTLEEGREGGKKDYGSYIVIWKLCLEDSRATGWKEPCLCGESTVIFGLCYRMNLYPK